MLLFYFQNNILQLNIVFVFKWHWRWDRHIQIKRTAKICSENKTTELKKKPLRKPTVLNRFASFCNAKSCFALNAHRAGLLLLQKLPEMILFPELFKLIPSVHLETQDNESAKLADSLSFYQPTAVPALGVISSLTGNGSHALTCKIQIRTNPFFDRSHSTFNHLQRDQFFGIYRYMHIHILISCK